jgi:hypothetical protein
MKQLFYAILLALLAAGGAWAAPAGEVTHLSGTLSVRKADGTSKLLAIQSAVEEGDVVSTEADTYARIKFVDGGEVVLRPRSQLRIESYRYDEAKPQGDNILLNMLKGGLRAVTGLIGKRNKEKIAYRTPTATIGIRGTHFGALFCQGDCGDIATPSGEPPANGLHVDVTSGAVSITNGAGSFPFDAGQFAFVPSAEAPPELIPPDRGIRVTMPGSIAANRSSGSGIGTGNASECSVE